MTRLHKLRKKVPFFPFLPFGPILFAGGVLALQAFILKRLKRIAWSLDELHPHQETPA